GSALGFVPAGMENGFRFEALFPDYTVAGLPEWVGYIVSAIAGAAILVIVFRLVSLVGRNRRKANA
ncbi:MAG TPA: PDGLE domain-containing protein, partial [Spirochaetia bacterium]